MKSQISLFIDNITPRMFHPDKKLTAKKCYECWVIVKNYR